MTQPLISLLKTVGGLELLTYDKMCFPLPSVMEYANRPILPNWWATLTQGQFGKYCGQLYAVPISLFQ